MGDRAERCRGNRRTVVVMDITIEAVGSDLWAAIQAIGSILAILAGFIYLGIQHWSSHDVAKAEEGRRMDRLGQLCTLIAVDVTTIEGDAEKADWDSFDWAFMRTDRARLEPLVAALDGIDLLSLPSNEAMAATTDLAAALRTVIASAEALTSTVLNGKDDLGQRRSHTATVCRAAVKAAENLRNAV